MPATYEPIETQTLGTAVADVFFTSIPQTYTDLVLIMTGGCAANAGIGYRFNADTTTNYSVTFLEGNGSAASSNRNSSQTFMRIGFNATWSTDLTNTAISNIQNYTNTTTFKTVLSRVNGLTVGALGASVGLWRKTPEALTALTVLTSNGSNFLVGSTFTLYGIKAA
jgi:hypothetical protein